jgi:hypothetical protein
MDERVMARRTKRLRTNEKERSICFFTMALNALAARSTCDPSSNGMKKRRTWRPQQALETC